MLSEAIAANAIDKSRFLSSSFLIVYLPQDEASQTSASFGMILTAHLRVKEYSSKPTGNDGQLLMSHHVALSFLVGRSIMS